MQFDNSYPVKKLACLFSFPQTIQNLGNLGLQLGKEVWMQPLHPFILNSVKEIKLFIDEIVDVNEATAGEESFDILQQTVHRIL